MAVTNDHVVVGEAPTSYIQVYSSDCDVSFHGEGEGEFVAQLVG